MKVSNFASKHSYASEVCKYICIQVYNYSIKQLCPHKFFCKYVSVRVCILMQVCKCAILSLFYSFSFSLMHSLLLSHTHRRPELVNLRSIIFTCYFLKFIFIIFYTIYNT